MGLTHEIHTSERKSFKGCRLRWHWHFREYWTPIGMAPPLEFGISYHKGMETLYDPATWDWDRQVVGELAVKSFVDSCNEQRRIYLRESGDASLEPAIQEEYDERVALGSGMLRYYYQKQLPKHPDGFRPIKVEIPFEVPILHPETGQQLYCKCISCWTKLVGTQTPEAVDAHMSPFEKLNWKGLPVTYAGRIDCLGEDANGDYWIVDWKTARTISTDDEFLYLDDQIGSYVWALRSQLGLPVRGFIYHEQKKGFPQPPTENKVPRLGCSYSVSKSQDTDYETYLETIKLYDTQAYASGSYDKFLQWLEKEGPKYYERWQIIKTDEELENIGIDIGLEALDMIDPNLRIYRNAGRFGCKFCAFRQPCLGRHRNEDTEFTLSSLFKKEAPYYERQRRGPSTEHKGGE